MHPNPIPVHPRIHQIISEYMKLLNERRPGLIEGLYIYGSIAYGDYSLSLSDIDFIAVSKHRLEHSDFAEIVEIHRLMQKSYPKPPLEGIYLTWEDIGRLENIKPYPYYHAGKMHESGYFELNRVTWYELRTCGITILGPEVSELAIDMEWELLIRDMEQNLNSYWRNWIEQSGQPLSLKSLSLLCHRGVAEWGVLGITRLFYTFRENQITTKFRAGEYALGVVPEKWHRIITECMNYRNGISQSLYRSIWQRKKDALGYMNYILNECNSR